MTENLLKSSVLLRMGIVAFMTLILLIPTAIVESVIRERSNTRDEAILEISDKWGRPQTITGPILTVPVKRTTQDEKGKQFILVDYLHILPKSLQIKGTLTTESRARGIYEAILYNGHIQISGELTLDDIPPLVQESNVPVWADAVLTVGLSDLRGIKKDVTMNVNGDVLAATSGVQTTDVVTTGITFQPQINAGTRSYTFSFSLVLNGSSEILFCPVGKNTTVQIESPWPSPSFIGAFLPDSRSLDQSGFSGTWNILELNRNFPQFWKNKRFEVAESTFGVRLLRSVDEYQKTLRTAKYAILIISLTFLAFFLSEILSEEILHPINYALVGLGLVLFFLLLLALSEHVGFKIAYVISAISILSCIGLYTLAVSIHQRTAAIVSFVLFLLYTFLYVVLQNEDYALLIGSLGLLIILATVMWLTRKVNWYSAKENG